MFDDKFEYSYNIIEKCTIQNAIHDILMHNKSNNDYILIVSSDSILERLPIFGENVSYSKKVINKNINSYGTCERNVNCVKTPEIANICLNLTNVTLDILCNTYNEIDIDLSIINSEIKSDVAIVQIYSTSIESFAKFSMKCNSLYARKLKYAYYCYFEDDINTNPTYSKSKYITQLLSTYNNVLYIDSDAVITNMHIDIQRMNVSEKELVCCRDYGNWLMNAGVLLFNKSNTQNILNMWNTLCMKSDQNISGHDQSLLINVLQKYYEDVLIKNEKTYNCHYNEWNSNMFILHLMGMSETFRIAAL